MESIHLRDERRLPRSVKRLDIFHIQARGEGAGNSLADLELHEVSNAPPQRADFGQGRRPDLTYISHIHMLAI